MGAGERKSLWLIWKEDRLKIERYKGSTLKVVKRKVKRYWKAERKSKKIKRINRRTLERKILEAIKRKWDFE